MMSRALLLCLASLAAQFSAHAEWPRIVSQTDRFHIVSPIRKSPVDVPIRDIDGKAVYRLVCGSFDTPIGDFAYSGDFECFLQTVPPNYHGVSSLFAEAMPETADWQTRGRFFAREIKPPCDEIPDFGADRTFRLRGMKITLSLSNIEFDIVDGRLGLKTFDFSVSVIPDRSATSAIAEPPTLDPKWRGTGCALDNSVTPHF